MGDWTAGPARKYTSGNSQFPFDYCSRWLKTSHTKPAEQTDILRRFHLASVHSGLDYVFNPALGFSFVHLKMPACGSQIGDFRRIKRAKGHITSVIIAVNFPNTFHL
ncbi:unnamed protein product [Leuciscus chuanchicus]